MRRFVIAIGLVASAASSAQDAPPPLTALAPGAAMVVGDLPVTAPQEGIDSWSEWRRANDIPPVSIANLPLETTAAMFSEATAETVAWERALLAVEVSQETVSVWAGEQWLAVLDDALDPRALVWTGLYVDGSAAALLDRSCMPLDPSILGGLRQGARMSAYRNGSPLEAAPSLPADGTLRDALAGEGGAAIAASLAFVAAGFEGVGVPTFEASDGCDPSTVIAMADLGETELADWERVLPGLEAVAMTRPIPYELIRRIAVHWYLATRPTALSTLLHLWDEGAASERAMLEALAHGAAGNGEAMARALDDVSLPDDPYATWVRAEAARQSGEARTARDLATAAVDADPFFAAAYLTRASTQIALGTPNEALRDLEHLRRTFGTDPTYAGWILALDRRLR